ncbi:uncharacterized protein LOC112574347 [Pomacea canaliculata]|nr:uncharacterized protein LOC112574347 [Pomacea canaliculata]
MSDEQTFVTKAPEGRCAIRFDDVPRDESLNQYKLYFNPDESEASLPEELQLESYVVVNSSPKSLIFRLPVPGLYQVHILDKHGSELIYLLLECSGPIKKQRPLPITPEAGFGFGTEAQDAGLSEPSREDGMLDVREGEKIRFKFRTQPSTNVRARLVHHDRGSDEFTSRVAHEQKGDQVTVSVRVPYDDHNPEYGLQIDTWEGGNDSDYINVLNYLLTQDQQLTSTVKGRKEQIRDELKLAITDMTPRSLRTPLSSTVRPEVMTRADNLMRIRRRKARPPPPPPPNTYS